MGKRKRKDLLTGRLEFDSDTGKLVKKSPDFRHYLRVKTPDHRRALTRMVLSGHSLAVERRRWKERGKPLVPRKWRKCRFCQEFIEVPAHAMFICDHLELTQVRKAILADLYAKVPEFKGAYMDKMEYFRAILAKREVTPILAKLAFNVLRIYDAPQCYFWNHQRPLIPHPCELSWPGASVGSLLGSQNFLIPVGGNDGIVAGH
jgi:hypothetical protein